MDALRSAARRAATPLTGSLLVLVGLALAVSIPGVLCAQETRPAESELLRRAEAALSRGDPATAVTLLQEALAEDGRQPRLLFYLGRAYLEGGQLQEALAAFRRARAASVRPNVAVLFWEGVTLERLGDIDGARERLGAVLEADPHSEGARLQLGWILLAEERAAEAEDLFAEVIRDHPISAVAHYYLGLARHARADLRGARDAYRKAVDLDPALADARVALGRVEHELGEPEAARATLEAAVERFPGLPDAVFELGRLDLEAGDVESAITRLEAVVAADPSHAAARYQLGLAYRRVGRVLESEAMLAGYAALESGHQLRQRRALGGVAAASSYERALDHLAAGEPDEAAASFRATLRAAGDDATAAPWLGLGAACLESGDAACAVDALEHATRLEPELAVGHLLLAQALDTLGRADDAQAALARWRSLVGAQADGESRPRERR